MSAKTQSSAIESELIPKASFTDEEKLQIIAKVSADAIYDWDIEAGVTRWNHGMRTLFGYAGDTVQTHHWWQERIFPDDKERVVESVRKALEKKWITGQRNTNFVA